MYLFTCTHKTQLALAQRSENWRLPIKDWYMFLDNTDIIHICMYIHTSTRIYMHECEYMYIYIHTYTRDTQLVKRNKIRRLPVLDWYIFLTTFLTTYRLCIHICVYVYIHICAYVYIHTNVYKEICTHVLT